MRIILIVLIFLFSNPLFSKAGDSTFKFYRLRFVGLERHKETDFIVYIFRGLKKIEPKEFIFVFTDSLQNSFFQNKSLNIKTRELVVGKVYNICLKELYYFDWPEADRYKRSQGFRGMNIYRYLNVSGFVYISHDIQNGRILKRRRKDTIDYFKRKPIMIHGYGSFPG